MPYQINTNASFVIDGDELNAGNRAFARDFRSFVIDGTEVGTASLRQFLKDHRTFVISGGVSNADRPRVGYSAMFSIEGRPYADGVYAFPINFVLDGRLGDYSLIAGRSTCAFVIDDVSQETPP